MKLWPRLTSHIIQNCFSVNPVGVVSASAVELGESAMLERSDRILKHRNRNKLFIETGGLSDVVLNWYGEAVEKLEPYAKAYHSAAQLLIEKSTGDQLRDIGACPVVFLYRLSLELYLKAILILGSSILRFDGFPFRTVEEILNQRHNLPGLWKEFETLCGLLDWEWETEYEACGDMLMELHEKDPGSFCFRYPIKNEWRSCTRARLQIRSSELLRAYGRGSCSIG